MVRLQKQLVEDLEALTTLLVSSEPLPPSHVRITASAVLRKWFIDDNLSKLSHDLKTLFTVPSFDTSKIIEAVASETDIRFFLAGGVVMDGVPIRGFYVSDSPPPSESAQIPINEMSIDYYKPSRYLMTNRIYFEGEWFNVDKIIKFAANKYGGVHFDEKREKDWQSQLEIASKFFVLGNPDGQSDVQIIEPYSSDHQILLVLPKERNNLWNCIDVELLASAQSLVNLRAEGNPLL